MSQSRTPVIPDRAVSPSRRDILRVAGAGAVGLMLAACGGDKKDNELVVTPPDTLPGEPSNPGEGPGTPPTPPSPLAAVTTPDVVPEVLSTFIMGVTVGDVSSTDAFLWTRYLGKQKLGCVLWEMQDTRYLRVAGTLEDVKVNASYAHINVSGLEAGKRYRYAFVEMDDSQDDGEVLLSARSRVGNFRAAIADDAVEPLTLGAISCIKATEGYSLAVLDRVGERHDLDFMMLLGDTAYNDGSMALSSFRRSWYNSLGRTEWLNFRAATSVLATWDDHEIDNDWDATVKDSDVVSAARQAFFENLPVRQGEEAPERVYRSRKWGKTVEVFVLDCRSERNPGTGTYISATQMDWLKKGLSESDAVFKIIMNSVPIGEFPMRILGSGIFDSLADSWSGSEGYKRQRTELLGHIEGNKIPGVFFISGDFHMASVGRVGSAGQPGSSILEVLAGPGAQSGNPGQFALRRDGNPLDWTTNDNNYASFDLDPIARQVRVRHHNGAGVVIQDSTFKV